MITKEDYEQLNKDLKKLFKSSHRKNELLKEIQELSHYTIPRPAHKQAKLLRFMPEIIFLYHSGYGANRICKWLALNKKFKVSESYLVKTTREVYPDAFKGKAGTFEGHVKHKSSDRY